MEKIPPPKEEPAYRLPFLNQPISPLTLRVSQVSLALFATLSKVLPLSQNTSWGIFAFSSLGLFGTFFIKKEGLASKTLKATEESLQDKIIPLSGLDQEGNEWACPLETFKNLIQELRRGGNIQALNSLSSYDPENSQSYELLALTPLQHWAKRGDLLRVQLLIKNGAADHCIGKHADTSALFQALLYGHIDIVNYLLSIGARSYVTLNEKTPLHLKIPIAKGKHPLSYVQNHYKNFQGKENLIECLSLFKKDDEVFLPEEISENPLTLQELGEQKSGSHIL